MLLQRRNAQRDHVANNQEIYERQMSPPIPPYPLSTQPICGQPLYTVLDDGAWAGQRCFLIGGGPSLIGFDFSRLDGELIIGINRAYEKIDPAITYTMDTRFIAWASSGTISVNARKKLYTSLATRVFSRASTKNYPKGFYIIERSGSDLFQGSLRKGWCGHNNSGSGALSLAIALGCSEIYLLGFDMHGDPVTDKQTWWHSGYPADSIQKASVVYKAMRTAFGRHADAIKERACVINCNPDSALRCFEFGDLPEPCPPRPTVVGFYTAGTGYEAEAREMIASAHRMGLRTDVRAIENQGWQRNTSYKPRLLQEMVEKYWGSAIVYTDADSRFMRYPALFNADSGLADFAYHRHKSKEVLSGTLFIRCNKSTAALMRLWAETCEQNPQTWDQRNLEIALGKWDGSRSILPAEYCCIFDYKPAPDKPVVIHYQASRRLKKEVGA